jgi:hypothetical protein
MRHLAWTLCAVTLVAAGCGGSSATLKRVFPPLGGFSITVPSNWPFASGDSEGDHVTYFWYDPHDPFAKLRIVVSGCRGCVTKNQGNTPYPRGDLPQDATVTKKSDPYTLSFRKHDRPYRDDGMVVVTHNSLRVTGSFIIDLWLPDKNQTEAAQILASFRQ